MGSLQITGIRLSYAPEPPPEPPYCEICQEDQTQVPGMVLARFRGGDICTDCLSANPYEDDYREQLAVWEERFFPITRCQYCQCLTQTAQDPQGPDGGCARCVQARQTLWERFCAALRADDRSTVARLGQDYRRTYTPRYLRRGFTQTRAYKETHDAAPVSPR